MKYFKIEELTHSLTAKAHSIANVPTAEAEKNLEILVDCVLDRIREHWGHPIVVSSGYRCEALNEAVGGVKNSYHRLGMAADIYPVRGGLEALYDCIKTLFMQGKIGLSECYIDRKKGFIHVAYDNGGFNVWPFVDPL